MNKGSILEIKEKEGCFQLMLTVNKEQTLFKPILKNQVQES